MLTIEFAVAAMYMDSVACRGVVVEGTKNEERKVQPCIVWEVNTITWCRRSFNELANSLMQSSTEADSSLYTTPRHTVSNYLHVAMG